MSTIQSPFAYSLAAPAQAIARRGAAWFWLTTLFVFAAFFLAVHEPDASKKWTKAQKSEVNSLADEEENGRASRQIGFLMLGGIGVLLLATPGAIAIRPRPVLVFSLSMLLVWTLMSAAWSADVAITLKRQVVLVCMLLAVAGLIKQFSISQLAVMGVAHCLLVIGVGLAAEQILNTAHAPPGEEYRFAGTLHPNHMGINASILLFCSLFMAQRRQDRRYLLIAAIAFVTLYMTKSRTALFSAFVGYVAFAMLAYSPRNRVGLTLALLLGSAITMAISSTDLFSSFGQTVLLNRSTSDPTTLTGRTMIWQFAYDRIRGDWGRILAGYGYGAFWTRDNSAALSQRMHFALAEGHNAYLDVTLQLGLVGLMLYLICILGTLRYWTASAFRSGSIEAAMAVGLLCFTLNHHIAESAMTAPTFPTLILWCLIASVALTGGDPLTGANSRGGESFSAAGGRF